MTTNGSPVPRRGVWGWMLFDWAAQPFFTVVTTFIFGPYFVSRMATDHAAGQAAWGYGIAAAGFVIAIMSPVLGLIADQTGPRKPWIGFFAIIQIVALSLLWFAAPGSPLIWPLLFFSLASVAAEFSIVFNDSMMPRLVSKEEIGRVSNIAWMSPRSIAGRLSLVPRKGTCSMAMPSRCLNISKIRCCAVPTPTLA